MATLTQEMNDQFKRLKEWPDPPRPEDVPERATYLCAYGPSGNIMGCWMWFDIPGDMRTARFGAFDKECAELYEIRVLPVPCLVRKTFV